MTKTIHLSFDDVIEVFEDLYMNQFDSIFSHPFLAYLKSLHDRYSIKCSLFCFYENERFNLSMMPEKYRKEWKECEEWLRFGFHSLNSSKRYLYANQSETIHDYQTTIREIVRFSSKNQIAHSLRMHYYECGADAMKALSSVGVKALFVSDREQLGQYFDMESTKVINKYGYLRMSSPPMTFVKTNLRIELMEDVLRETSVALETPYPHLVIFSHEWAMKLPLNRIRLENVCQMLYREHGIYDLIEY